MASIEKVDRGLYRVTNNDGSISWMIDYQNPDKKRIRKTYSTKKEAVQERAKRVSMIAEGEYSNFVEKKKAYNKTFGDLIIFYVEMFQDQTSFRTAKQHFIEKFREHFVEDTLLKDIHFGNLELYRNKLKRHINQHGRLLTESSINSEMSCLRQMFRKALTHGMIELNPFNGGESLRLKVNNERNQYLTPDEARKLFNHCPIHLQQIVECVLYTGMRQKEVLTLKWGQIKEDWIYLTDTKPGKPLKIPVSDSLKELFARIKESQATGSNVIDMNGKQVEPGLKSEHVFTYQGQPIKEVKTAFRTACKRARIPYGRYTTNGITFHDLRHSYGTLLVQQGVNFRATQDLMGHSNPKMTQRYTHVADEIKKQAVNGLNWNLH